MKEYFLVKKKLRDASRAGEMTLAQLCFSTAHFFGLLRWIPKI